MNIIRKTYQFCKKTLEKIIPNFYLNLINKYKIGIKYIISGGTAAAVDLGLLYIFTDVIGLWYLYSAIISFIFSLLTSFLLHKFWTFRENSLKRIKKQFIFFCALAFLNLGINTILMYIAVELLGIWYILSQFFIMGFIAFMNFVVNKTITFKPENKDNKNILIATGIYPPDIGGPATYVRILQEELPKHGFNVKIVTYGEQESRINNHASEDVYYISRKQSKPLRYFKYFWRVLNLLSWANTVYAQGPVSEGYPVYWACRLRSRKYILKVVGDYAWEQYQVASNKLQVTNNKFVTLDEFQNKRFDSSTEKKRRIEHKVAQHAEKIVVPSFYLKKIMKQWGVSEDKINVIYNAVEFKDVESIKKPADEKWLVSVARLVPWKGIDILIQIMPELLKHNSNLKLKIIGDGPEKNNLQLLITNDELEKNIVLTGKLSHDEVLGYLQAGDVFVLNTGYEGLPHTTLEAMHANLPIVTTSVCGNPEVVEDNRTGLLVEYNDKEQIKNAILKLLNNQDLVNKLTNNAKNSLGKFDKQKMINNTIEILKS